MLNKNVYILLCVVRCKVLPHHILHRSVPPFNNARFLFVICRVKCHIISRSYCLKLLLVEFSTLICLQAARSCISEEQFTKRIRDLLANFGFKRQDPIILVEYINHSQEGFVTVIRSGQR